MSGDEYRALAELRYRIRRFLREAGAVARAAGLEPQQYLMLLVIRGLPRGDEATIRTLADRVVLKHHSTNSSTAWRSTVMCAGGEGAMTGVS